MPSSSSVCSKPLQATNFSFMCVYVLVFNDVTLCYLSIRFTINTNTHTRATRIQFKPICLRFLFAFWARRDACAEFLCNTALSRHTGTQPNTQMLLIFHAYGIESFSANILFPLISNSSLTIAFSTILFLRCANLLSFVWLAALPLYFFPALPAAQSYKQFSFTGSCSICFFNLFVFSLIFS